MFGLQAIGCFAIRYKTVQAFTIKCSPAPFRCAIMKRLATVADSHTDKLLEGYDDMQIKFMEEPCILVNDQDQVIGTAKKKTCHLLENISQNMLHRAFSVFLFNMRGELLLQQRAETKITFPGLFTNTCCSHPLNFELEKEETNAIGVKRAAQRKLFHELGIRPDQIPLDVFQYITRIQYMAENVPQDGKFGENEIDYCLVVKKEVDVVMNPNEVKSYKYVSKDELKELIELDNGERNVLTPWFRMICDKFLFTWWENLDNLKSYQDHGLIHKFS